MRKNIFIFIRFLVFWMVFTPVFNAFAEDRPVIAVFDYPPYMDHTLPDKGLFCALADAAFRAGGASVDFQFFPLKRATAMVERGIALSQLGTIWNFPESSRKELEPVSMFYYRVVGFYLKDRHKNISFKKLGDLKNYKIGVMRGSSDAQALESLDIEEFSSVEALFSRVWKSPVFDMVTLVELSGLWHIRKYYPDDTERWGMTEDAVQGLLGQNVFSKKHPYYEEYLDKFRKGLALIRENGEYHRIFESYYGKGKVPPVVEDLDHAPYLLEP